MDRKEFIDTLFDNGHGLTLDQIQAIEDDLPSIFPTDDPEEFIENILRTMDDKQSREDAFQTALCEARDVLIEGIRSCNDLLEVKDYFKSYFQIELTDIQTFRMSLL